MTDDDRQTKALTSAGLNLIQQALSIYDRDLRLAVCNRRFQEMFALPDALVAPGARFEDTVRHLVLRGEYGPVGDTEEATRERVDIARAFEPHYLERTRPNGQTISVEGSPLPQGGWVAVYTDITRTRQAEQLLRARSEELSDQLLAHAEELSAANRKLAATITALEETKRQLTESEARTRLTTEMVPAHIAHVDADGVYTYSNRRLNSILPGRPSEIVGMPLAQALGPVVYERIAPHLHAAWRGESSVFEFTEDHGAKRIRAAFTPDRAGGVYILSMDITAETQARAALQQSRRRALAAQMTRGLAHDFSNLLTIILGMQGKLERMDLGTEAAKLVAATRGAAQRGARLLDRIGDMTGHRTLRPRPTDMHVLLDDLKILAGSSLPPSVGLGVTDDLPDAEVLVDPGMLQDALLNLILNARDACGVNGRITVHARCVADTWLELAVRDTGPGFSDGIIDKALDPFFTTKGGEGSGLGLPMAYDMAKLAGGDLRLGNTDTGAAVILRLPWREAPQIDGGLALLVEDSAELRATFRDMLMELGFAVIEAESVDEASALAADLPDIALVLSDIQLRGNATGIDLLDRIDGSDLPCILMTSLAPDDALFLQAAARAPVLRKPFTADDLLAQMAQRSMT